MLVTKCCQAEREIEFDSSGYPSRAYCDLCEADNPKMIVVYEDNE